MPIHDWTRVDAGIFHGFHVTWIGELAGALNDGVLPPEFYALPEQIIGPLGPDIITLRNPGTVPPRPESVEGGLAVADTPPQVRHHIRSEVDQYAAKANVVAIRHVSNHQIVALIEIVSPGSKSNRHGLRAFVKKAVEALAAGIHLLVVDLFPPGPRDPEGLHPLIWEELLGEVDPTFKPLPKLPLTLAAYFGGVCPEAYVESVAVGSPLPAMPLFLAPGTYVQTPLDTTYELAWKRQPTYWGQFLEQTNVPEA